MVPKEIFCIHWEEWLCQKEGWPPEWEAHALRYHMEAPEVTQWHFNVPWITPLILDPQRQNSGPRNPSKGSDVQQLPSILSEEREVAGSQHRPSSSSSPKLSPYLPGLIPDQSFLVFGQVSGAQARRQLPALQ